MVTSTEELALLQVARSAAELEAAIQRPRTPQPKSQWTHQIPELDPAFLWAMCLAPTYGVNILGSRAALSFRVGFLAHTSCLLPLLAEFARKWQICLSVC